jgi:hypothetical protein
MRSDSCEDWVSESGMVVIEIVGWTNFAFPETPGSLVCRTNRV